MRDPVAPGPGGHFDHVTPGTDEFSAAAVFASVRCTLEVWESYFGRQIPWHFRERDPRLEVIPQVRDNTAWAGNGFVEFGRLGGLLCENFDVVAHEVGHCLVRSVMGRPAGKPLAFQAFDEASADLMAVVASLHFEEVVEHLMTHTRGNLFSTNILARVGELNRREQVRNVLNGWTMDRAEDEFVDDDAPEVPALAALHRGRLRGAGGDLRAGPCSSAGWSREALVATLADGAPAGSGPDAARVPARLSRHEAAFTTALLDARDYFGRLLARTWEKTGAGPPERAPAPRLPPGRRSHARRRRRAERRALPRAHPAASSQRRGLAPRPSR